MFKRSQRPAMPNDICQLRLSTLFHGFSSLQVQDCSVSASLFQRKKNVTRTTNRRPGQCKIIFKKANSKGVESLPPAATGTRPYMLRKAINQLVVIKKGPPTKRRGVMVADQPTNFTYFYLLYINSIQPVSRLFSLLPLIQRIEACLHWASRTLKKVLVQL